LRQRSIDPVAKSDHEIRPRDQPHIVPPLGLPSFEVWLGNIYGAGSKPVLAKIAQSGIRPISPLAAIGAIVVE
jgi:hypothetical protein